MKYSILITKKTQLVEPVSVISATGPGGTTHSSYIYSINCFYNDVLTSTQSTASDIKTNIKEKLHLSNVVSEELCFSGLTASITDSTVVTFNKLDYYVTIG